MTKKNIEAVARSLVGSAPGATLSEAQLATAEEFVGTLMARGFSIIPKGDADQVEWVRRKTGGVHPVAPGQWQVNSTQNGWISFWAGFHSNESPGMFSPGEAREIAMSLIIFAAQEEQRR